MSLFIGKTLKTQNGVLGCCGFSCGNSHIFTTKTARKSPRILRLWQQIMDIFEDFARTPSSEQSLFYLCIFSFFSFSHFSVFLHFFEHQKRKKNRRDWIVVVVVCVTGQRSAVFVSTMALRILVGMHLCLTTMHQKKHQLRCPESNGLDWLCAVEAIPRKPS